MIYLDHAAATPLSPKALAAMTPYFTEQFLNPSSPYLPAKQVQADYRAAKATIAQHLGAKSADLIITSGATEANALACTCLAPDGEALLAATEHASMRACLPHAQEITVDRFGLIDQTDLQAKITTRTELISIALANNELGTIQPLAEISAIIRAERQRRLEAGEKRPLYLHTDASQALNLMNINVARLGVDLMTINAAKVYGPKGVGALYVGRGIRLKPLFAGGGQERGLRGGTENVPGVIGFATALTEAQDHLSSNRKKYTELTNILRANLQRAAIQPVFLGHPKHQLANFCPVSFPGIDAERLVFLLEAQGVLVSTGAACAANKGTKSHVLAAIGLTDQEIAGSLRLSLGATNTVDDITAAAELINQAVALEAARCYN